MNKEGERILSAIKDDAYVCALAIGGKMLDSGELTEEIEKELDNYISSIEQLLAQEKPPECIQTNTCKKCAYYEYCYI